MRHHLSGIVAHPLMRRARVEQSISRQDYWSGYQRGLRRAFQGESYGTDEEHAFWCTLAERPDHKHREQGEGYLAGLAALDEHERPPLPSAQGLQAFLKRHGITGSEAARMMYLSDSRQVRKYTGGESPRQLDGARWFALHAHVMLTPRAAGRDPCRDERQCKGRGPAPGRQRDLTMQTSRIAIIGSGMTASAASIQFDFFAQDSFVKINYQ